MKLFKARDVFAFMFYGAFIYLVCTQQQIPDSLLTIIASLLGYYYGTRSAPYTKGGE
jgi:hypothetical protein